MLVLCDRGAGTGLSLFSTVSIENQDVILRLACVAGVLKGKGKGVLGKGVLGARETRGAREEGGRKTPARKPLFFAFLTSTKRMLKS